MMAIHISRERHIWNTIIHQYRVHCWKANQFSNTHTHTVSMLHQSDSAVSELQGPWLKQSEAGFIMDLVLCHKALISPDPLREGRDQWRRLSQHPAHYSGTTVSASHGASTCLSRAVCSTRHRLLECLTLPPFVCSKLLPLVNGDDELL
jgi:hypothetical protein